MAFLVQGQESVAPSAGALGQSTAGGEFAFSADGLTLCTTRGNVSGNLWDVRTGAKRGALVWGRLDDTTVQVAAFSWDGESIVAGGDKKLEVWDAKTLRKLGALDTGTLPVPSRLTFSRDSRSALGTGGGGFQVWDLGRDPEAETVVASVRQVAIHQDQGRVEFTPDGKSLVSVTRDAGKRGVAVRDAKTLTPRGEVDFEALELKPRSFAFRPSEPQLAVGCETRILFDLTRQRWRK